MSNNVYFDWIPVSHTTADLVFQWTKQEAQAFFINPQIELPKLQLENQYTNDCSQSYTTGKTTVPTHFFSILSTHSSLTCSIPTFYSKCSMIFLRISD